MKHPTWWKPEYDELSEYNSEKSRASGTQYKVAASPSERLAARNAAQNWLNSLSPEYVARMEAIQADYNAVCAELFFPRDESLFGKVRSWWFGE